ncbi:MAG: DinB family protein [Gemmatimonadetes bacterium]|nr:DinB family protein [Gemmatimonadota bacterium]
MQAQAMLAQFNHIAGGTVPVLESIRDEDIDWRPHEKSWTLGALAGHIANLPNWCTATLGSSEFDVMDSGDDLRTEYDNAADIVAAFKASCERAVEALASASDEDLASPWTLLVGGEARFTMPKGAVVRGFILDHIIHHRAQVGMCLRLLGIPVPQTMGPTADYPDM